MSIKTFKRYEKKYMLNEYQFKELTSRLYKYMKADKHCRDGNYYTIFNIYYDTENHDIIRHSISKPYYKEKLRLRTYTLPTSLNDEVFLELKKKVGGIVCKRRATMTLKEAYDFIENGKIPPTQQYINRQVIQEIDYFLKNNKVTPRVCISYERIAYFSKEDNNFRLTFDRNIRAKRENIFLEDENLGKRLVEKNQYLMEVKILGAIPIWLTTIFSELKIYSSSFSKYGTEFKRHCEESGRPHENFQQQQSILLESCII